MKRTILVFGAIASIILAVTLSISTILMKAAGGPASYSMAMGYLSMLIAFAFVFVAVRSYRDRYNGGVISFGKAFQIGLWITLIASAAYTLTWIILYKTYYPNFMADYTAQNMAHARAAGKSDADLARIAADARDMQAVYDTWPGIVGFTLLEILPVGLLVSLVAAAILKRRTPRGVKRAVPAT